MTHDARRCLVCRIGTVAQYRIVDAVPYLRCDYCSSIYATEAHLERAQKARPYDDTYWREELKTTAAAATARHLYALRRRSSTQGGRSNAFSTSARDRASSSMLSLNSRPRSPAYSMVSSHSRRPGRAWAFLAEYHGRPCSLDDLFDRLWTPLEVNMARLIPILIKSDRRLPNRGRQWT
jgi:hypothetical protein